MANLPKAGSDLITVASNVAFGSKSLMVMVLIAFDTFPTANPNVRPPMDGGWNSTGMVKLVLGGESLNPNVLVIRVPLGLNSKNRFTPTGNCDPTSAQWSSLIPVGPGVAIRSVPLAGNE